MLDTLSEFLFRIQNQLEKTRVLDVAKSQKAEQEMEHRQEIVRILSSQTIPASNEIGAGDSENATLVHCYQQENERLFQKTKELELKVKSLEGQNSEFSNDPAVRRLENLLNKEEGLRRQIEISAREAKTQLEFEKVKTNQLSENVHALTIQLETTKNDRNRLKEQLSTRADVERKLRKEIEFFQSQTSSVSLESEIENMKKLQALEVRTIRDTVGKQKREIQRLELELDSRPRRARQNSSSSQTDSHPKPVSKADSPSKTLKIELNSVRQTLEELKRKLADSNEKLIRKEIENEKKDFELTRLKAELEEQLSIASKYKILQEELKSSEYCKNENEQLKSQLRASLDDRQVYEERYLQCVETIKVGQAEIDRRHSLVLDLHSYSIQVANDLKTAQNDCKRLEAELMERQYDLDHVRSASLPENLQYISQKLSDMEKDRSMREKKMKEVLGANDSDMNRLMADQSHTISKLKNDLTSKNNQFNRAQLQIREMETALMQMREQIKSSNYLLS